MFTRIIYFIFAIICFICSLFAFVPVFGNSIEAIVTENSNREVQVKRGGKFVYTKNKGIEQPKMRTEYIYSYEFTINGEKFTGSGTEYEFNHKKGSKITVYYLPFYPKIHTSIQRNHLFLFCGILFIASIVLLKSSITGRRAEIVIGGRANDIYHQDWGPKYPSADSVASVKEQIATPQPVQPQIQPQIIQLQQVQQQNIIKPSEYAFCPKCGTPLTSGYAFCPKCGLRLS